LQGFSGSGYFFSEVSGHVKDADIVVVGTSVVTVVTVVTVLVDVVVVVVGCEGIVDVLRIVVVIAVDSGLVAVDCVSIVAVIIEEKYVKDDKGFQYCHVILSTDGVVCISVNWFEVNRISSIATASSGSVPQ
jgi:hypothetical protein